MMTITTAFTATLITLALIFYSAGVWVERITRYLKGCHVAAFWTGFLFDVSGTWAMGNLAHPADSVLWRNADGNVRLILTLTLN